MIKKLRENEKYKTTTIRDTVSGRKYFKLHMKTVLGEGKGENMCSKFLKIYK